MHSLELYRLLFINALMGNLAISITPDLLLNVMKTLGTYNFLLIIATATIASFIAFSINYLLGKMLSNFLNKKNQSNQKAATGNKGLKNLDAYDNIYVVLFLLLGAIPFFGKFIPFFAGGLKIRYVRAISVCTFAKFCYYLMV